MVYTKFQKYNNNLYVSTNVEKILILKTERLYANIGWYFTNFHILVKILIS